MAQYAYLTSVKDRRGKFLGSYRCSHNNKGFLPIPYSPGEMGITFGIHVGQLHSSLEKEALDQRRA